MYWKSNKLIVADISFPKILIFAWKLEFYHCLKFYQLFSLKWQSHLINFQISKFEKRHSLSVLFQIKIAFHEKTQLACSLISEVLFPRNSRHSDVKEKCLCARFHCISQSVCILKSWDLMLWTISMITFWSELTFSFKLLVTVMRNTVFIHILWCCCIDLC